MLVKYHIFYGFFFSMILFLIFPFIGILGFLIIFSSSVLIDTDHYIYLALSEKIFNFKKSYQTFLIEHKKSITLSKIQKQKLPIIPCIFHGIEVLSVIFVLGLFFSNIFFFIFIGFMFHLFLDVIWILKYDARFDKISLIYDFINIRKYN